MDGWIDGQTDKQTDRQYHILCSFVKTNKNRDSSVSIVLRYGLDDRGSSV
jgi:hypothetical protein